MTETLQALEIPQPRTPESFEDPELVGFYDFLRSIQDTHPGFPLTVPHLAAICANEGLYGEDATPEYVETVVRQTLDSLTTAGLLVVPPEKYQAGGGNYYPQWRPVPSSDTVEAVAS